MVYKLEIDMDTEREELLLQYYIEVEKCYKIANFLDERNPTLKGAFTGTPSERIERQLNFILD